MKHIFEVSKTIVATVLLSMALVGSGQAEKPADHDNLVATINEIQSDYKTTIAFAKAAWLPWWLGGTKGLITEPNEVHAVSDRDSAIKNILTCNTELENFKKNSTKLADEKTLTTVESQEKQLEENAQTLYDLAYAQVCETTNTFWEELPKKNYISALFYVLAERFSLKRSRFDSFYKKLTDEKNDRYDKNHSFSSFDDEG